MLKKKDKIPKMELPRAIQNDSKLKSALAPQVKSLLANKENPEELRKIFKALPLRAKLILSPDLYAEDAVNELERQLAAARSPNRIAKLERKINMWKIALEQLQSVETEKEDDGEQST